MVTLRCWYLNLRWGEITSGSIVLLYVSMAMDSEAVMTISACTSLYTYECMNIHLYTYVSSIRAVNAVENYVKWLYVKHQPNITNVSMENYEVAIINWILMQAGWLWRFDCVLNGRHTLMMRGRPRCNVKRSCITPFKHPNV